MDLNTSRHSVMVFHTPVDDTTQAGRDVRALDGVSAVTADPARRQLVVRYDAEIVDAQRILARVRPVTQPSVGELWIRLLPKMAKAVPSVASLMS